MDLEYDTKLYVVMRLQFWNIEESGVLFHYHYSQVHSAPDFV